jgi:hypothetical protein
MKKRLLAVVVCLVLIASPSFAFLEAALSGGYVFFNQEGLPSSLDEGGFPALEARAGLAFGPLDLGLLVSYLPALEGSIGGFEYQLAHVPVLAFGKLGIPGSGLYLIGGLGFSFYTGDLLERLVNDGTVSISIEDRDFVWMVGAGYQIPLIDILIELGLDIGFRYYTINSDGFDQTAFTIQLGAYLSL